MQRPYVKLLGKFKKYLLLFIDFMKFNLCGFFLVCFRHVSCVASVSGLFILDCPLLNSILCFLNSERIYSTLNLKS